MTPENQSDTPQPLVGSGGTGKVSIGDAHPVGHFDPQSDAPEVVHVQLADKSWQTNEHYGSIPYVKADKAQAEPVLPRTPEEIVQELRSDSLLNRVRRVFSAECGRMEQIHAQEQVGPVEMRRMEFEAAQKLIAAMQTAAKEGA